MRLAWGTVSAIEAERAGLQRLVVTVDGESTSSRAIAYPALVGTPQVGERVLLNTTAVDLELGTGGVHFVVARAESTGQPLTSSGGHVMKLRYTPLQCDVLAVEEPAGPHAAVMETSRTLDDMPVVCCGLHSQILPVAAAIREADAELRIAYVMTDQAALALAFSDLVADMTACGLLDVTITSGQAFGGDLEAVTLHSALLAARHVAAADVAIVSLGPGILGTATPFGHGGVAQGEAVNATAALGGRPIAVLRVSFADRRPRHRGVSHHSIAALGVVALARAEIPLPAASAETIDPIDRALAEAGIWERHDRVRVDIATTPDTRGIPMRSMGRTPDDDPIFFLVAAAAGLRAADAAARRGQTVE